MGAVVLSDVDASKVLEWLFLLRLYCSVMLLTIMLSVILMEQQVANASHCVWMSLKRRSIGLMVSAVPSWASGY